MSQGKRLLIHPMYLSFHDDQCNVSRALRRKLNTKYLFTREVARFELNCENVKKRRRCRGDALSSSKSGSLSSFRFSELVNNEYLRYQDPVTKSGPSYRRICHPKMGRNVSTPTKPISAAVKLIPKSTGLQIQKSSRGSA